MALLRLGDVIVSLVFSCCSRVYTRCGGRSCRGRLFSEEEFKADEEEESSEGAFEVGGLDFAGEPGTEPAAGDGQRCDGQGGTPVDVSCACMLPGSDDGCGDDDAERGADGLFEVTDGGAEQEGHGGDHNDAATDAEESAGDSAEEADEAGEEVMHGEFMYWGLGVRTAESRLGYGCMECKREGGGEQGCSPPPSVLGLGWPVMGRGWPTFPFRLLGVRP